jgi:NAD(P)-dependent dehydrogenase (short-subunit alcohol dehydrogenase family)
LAGLITERLEGKIAVIIDGNSGIGLDSAQRFVQEGAFVFITGRRQNELDKAIEQIGKNVIGVQGDVSNLEDLDRLYDMVKQQKGRIDALFANGTMIPPMVYVMIYHWRQLLRSILIKYSALIL